MARFRGVLLVLLTTFVSVGAGASSEIVIPSGTSIHFKILRTISTATAQPGQTVPAELTAPIVVGGRTVATTGSPALVRIRNAESSGRIGGSAKLTLTLAAVTLANGSTVALHTSSYPREGRAPPQPKAPHLPRSPRPRAPARPALPHPPHAT